MPLWLDDRQVAIDDLTAACKATVDHCDDALLEIESPARRVVLERLRDDRRDDANRLSALVEASGQLPRAANADGEEFSKLVTRAKVALLDDDAEAVLVQDRLDGERELERLADTALSFDQPADMRACVERLRERSREAQERLAAALV